jgi:acetyltransferase-like isoleucine patch superfamily enzyme
MNIFRIRDFLSVILFRLCGFCFGSFGKRVRIVWPLGLYGVKNMRLADDVTIAFRGYVAALKEFDDEPLLTIGRGTRIGELAHIICSHKVTIGEDVLFANRLFISDCSHSYRDIGVPVLHQGLDKLSAVAIGNGAWVGENVCIIGCSIGRHCVIGANSVVTRDVPDYCVVAGAPARVVRRYCTTSQRWLATDADGSFRDTADA